MFSTIKVQKDMLKRGVDPESFQRNNKNNTACSHPFTLSQVFFNEDNVSVEVPINFLIISETFSIRCISYRKQYFHSQYPYTCT